MIGYRWLAQPIKRSEALQDIVLDKVQADIARVISRPSVDNRMVTGGTRVLMIGRKGQSANSGQRVFSYITKGGLRISLEPGLPHRITTIPLCDPDFYAKSAEAIKYRWDRAVLNVGHPGSDCGCE